MNPNAPVSRPIGFAIFTIIFGAIGWFASFELLNERIKTLINPEYTPSCDFSVLVTCGPNMASWQGSLFGFSNPILGVAMFVAPMLVGFAILAGASFAPWFWRCYQIGITLALVFVGWLISQSIFVLGVLCPWCMVVWVVVIPLAFTTLFTPAAKGLVPVSPRRQRLAQTLLSWNWVFILLALVLVAMLAEFRLGWVMELRRAFM